MSISFIIPCYNVESYLDDCIKSIINQNLEIDKYEIICIDDCSNDTTLMQLNNYSKLYNNIIVLANESNIGPSATRNKGIIAAKNEWIWFIDPDDVLANNIVNIFIREGISNEADIVVGCYSYIKTEYHYGEPYDDKLRIKFEKKIGRGLSQLPYSIYGEIGAGMWMGIVRRSFMIDNDLKFNERIFIVEDGMMHWEFEQYNPIVVRIPTVCYLYRYNPNSLSHYQSEERKIRNYSSEIERIKVYRKYEDEGLCVDIPKCHRLTNIANRNTILTLCRIKNDTFVFKEIKRLKAMHCFPLKHITVRGGIRIWIENHICSSIILFYIFHFANKIFQYFKKRNK